MTHIDVAIAGGGIVGSSTAYYLRKNGFKGSIAMFEQDTSFKHACTSLSWGGIRQQFSTPENILLSQFGLRLIRNLKEEFGADAEIGFKESGYLVLATEKGVEVLEENQRLQASMGADTVVLKGEELAKRFPWINFDGIAAGSFGPKNEGYFDPYSLMTLVRKAALARDVTLVPAGRDGGEERRADPQHHAWQTVRNTPLVRWSMPLARGRAHLLPWQGLRCRCGRQNAMSM
jgi:FAD-dependent oxidoreductase domain-containing protein 1